MNLKEPFAAFDLAESAVSVIVHPPAFCADKQTSMTVFTDTIYGIVPEHTVAGVKNFNVVFCNFALAGKVSHFHQAISLGSEEKISCAAVSMNAAHWHSYLTWQVLICKALHRRLQIIPPDKSIAVSAYP